ncbi:MAG TPA: acyl-CoA thioesterase [Crocinitomicaceae bacterium]|nr:acyl-CoA thioesterase [Crocinitomicaceae bacterium]
MGYCYYGNYAQYLEVGRVETLRELGMSYKQLEEDGFMLPVSELEINYKSPAFYDDLLSVETIITEVKGARIRFDYIVRNEKNRVIIEAKTVLVFVSKSTMRPVAPPSNFTQLIHLTEE